VRPTRHFFLAAWPVVGIWFTALGLSTMAFNLNGFIQRAPLWLFAFKKTEKRHQRVITKPALRFFKLGELRKFLYFLNHFLLNRFEGGL
jgi:hypothetical protein